MEISQKPINYLFFIPLNFLYKTKKKKKKEIFFPSLYLSWTTMATRLHIANIEGFSDAYNFEIGDSSLS